VLLQQLVLGWCWALQTGGGTPGRHLLLRHLHLLVLQSPTHIAGPRGLLLVLLLQQCWGDASWCLIC
jgi:hypothetical protein